MTQEETQQRTILVIDDDRSLRELVRIHLEHEGYRVLQASSGPEGLSTAREHQPDAVLIDLMMPDMDGLETCRRLREFSQVPVILLTAKRIQTSDIITGLDSGADDYIMKPFNMEELSARIRALLRRVPTPYRSLSVGNGQIHIDQPKREVTVRGEPVYLTPTEYQLLLILAENAGKVVEHDYLLRTVWGREYAKDHDYLKVYIWHLRRKVERDPRNPALLLTEWGVGYRMVP